MILELEFETASQSPPNPHPLSKHDNSFSSPLWPRAFSRGTTHLLCTYTKHHKNLCQDEELSNIGTREGIAPLSIRFIFLSVTRFASAFSFSFQLKRICATSSSAPHPGRHLSHADTCTGTSAANTFYHERLTSSRFPLAVQPYP